jgi:uncharacterized membrane protein
LYHKAQTPQELIRILTRRQDIVGIAGKVQVFWGKMDKRTKQTIKAIGLLAMISVVPALIAAILLSWGIASNPALVAFGMLSFAVWVVILFIITIVSTIIQQIAFRVKWPDLSRRGSAFSLDRAAQRTTNMRLYFEARRDPFMWKLSRVSTRIALLCLVLWGVLLIVMAIGTTVFKVPFLIRMLDYFR